MQYITRTALGMVMGLWYLTTFAGCESFQCPPCNATVTWNSYGDAVHRGRYGCRYTGLWPLARWRHRWPVGSPRRPRQRRGLRGWWRGSHCGVIGHRHTPHSSEAVGFAHAF